MSRATTFYKVRVAVLLAVLLGVVVWAWADVRSRRSRNEWDHTLEIAVVVLREGPVADDAIAALAERARVLEDRLTSELRLRRPKAPRPFHFTVTSALAVTAGPPHTQGEGVADLARHAYDQWRYLRDVDARAHVDAGAYDARIYLVVRPPVNERHLAVEGESEQGGRVGTVEVELDASMVDFALFVVTHELFHTLGATDKYDAEGRALVPDGLADPTLSPLYPQPRAEVMARNRVLAPGDERVPESLDQLGVGPATAREIGWTTNAR